jgi:TPR repeat protein
MYAEGMGTPKDPEAAYALLTAASMAGDQRGRDMVAKLEAQLTPQQIAHARQQAHNLPAPAGKQLSARTFAQ